MPGTMPPLRALVAFEAAVRHASFKDAARELYITPGAVSQQVQKLEQWLGFVLFVRQARQLEVTERGLHYYGRIAPALEQIGRASQACREQAANQVRLSLSITLAAKWLAPRMVDFIGRHPEIDVHINATNQTVDFQQEAVDLAIRYFGGQDPTMTSQLLFEDEVLLLCAPGYRDRLALRRPDDLRRATLLHVSLYPSWEEWLARFTSITEQERLPRLHVDQSLLGIDAARRGQGVVLSNRLLAEEELRRGELIEPFPLRLRPGKGYYLIHPRQRALSPAARILKDWLLLQFAEPPASGPGTNLAGSG